MISGINFDCFRWHGAGVYVVCLCSQNPIPNVCIQSSYIHYDLVNPVWWVRIRVTTYWIHWPQYNLALSDPQYKAHRPNPEFSLVKNDLLLFYTSFLYLYLYPHSQHWVEMSINNKKSIFADTKKQHFDILPKLLTACKTINRSSSGTNLFHFTHSKSLNGTSTHILFTGWITPQIQSQAFLRCSVEETF